MLLFVSTGDINKVGDKVLVARGGDGGMAANQYVGQKGDALSVTLDLKIISDIGLVGYVVDRNFICFKSKYSLSVVSSRQWCEVGVGFPRSVGFPSQSSAKI